MREIRKIVVHCSATREGLYYSRNDIDDWHRKRGMNGCGYHYIVLLDGTIQCGRMECQVGAHVIGHNVDSIGICYIGGLDRQGNPKDTRTEAQKKALRQLISKVAARYPKAKVYGHRDLSPDKNNDGVITKDEWLKECPCFDAVEEYKDLCCDN